MTVLVEDGTEFPLVESTAGDYRYGFLVVLEQGSSGWGAYVPDLPGVVAAADTEREVRMLIAEALDLHIEGMREAGEPIPEPQSRGFLVVR